MLMQLYMYWQMYSNFPLGEWTACMTIFYYPATQAPIHCLQNVTRWLLEVLLYVHRNHRFIRDGSPGRPPWLSHSSWALHIIHQLVDIMYYATAHWNIYICIPVFHMVNGLHMWPFSVTFNVPCNMRILLLQSTSDILHNITCYLGSYTVFFWRRSMY